MKLGLLHGTIFVQPSEVIQKKGFHISSRCVKNQECCIYVSYTRIYLQRKQSQYHKYIVNKYTFYIDSRYIVSFGVN